MDKVQRNRSAKGHTPWPDELLDFLFASTARIGLVSVFAMRRFASVRVWICSSREWSTGPQRVAGSCYIYLKGSFHSCFLTDSTARFVLDSLFAMLRFASVLIWFARPGSDRRCGELLDCAIYIYIYIKWSLTKLFLDCLHDELQSRPLVRDAPLRIRSCLDRSARELPTLHNYSNVQGSRLYNHAAFQGKQQYAVLAKYLIAIQLKFSKLD